MFLNNIDGARVNESEIYTKCIYSNLWPYTYEIKPHDITLILLLRSAGADLRYSHIHGSHTFTHSLIVFLGSWNLDVWHGNSEFWFLGFFDGFESFFLFLLIGLQSLGVVSADAKEVGPEEGNGDGEEKGPDDEGFLGLLVVTLIWGSNGNIFIFVAPEEVAGVPDTECARWVDHELAWNEKLWSRWIGVFSIVWNEEADSNEEWDKQDNSDKYVPPGELIVQKAVEDLRENGSEKSNSDDTDSDDTTLNWEASTASEIFCFFNGAVADAAAAEATLLFNRDFFESLCLPSLKLMENSLSHSLVARVVRVDSISE